MVSTVYLSRRNLVALLSKLDRKAAGEDTRCTINKNKQPSPEYQQTMQTINIVAVEDEEYYSSQNRAAGIMHPSDESKLTVPSTGVAL